MRRFLDGHDVVHIGIVKYLFDTAGPANLDFLYTPVRSQSEMYSTVAGGGVSNRSCCLVPLRATIFCSDTYLRPDPHPVASCSHQFQQYPVIVFTRYIAKELHRSTQHGNDHVHAPIIVDIPERNPAMGSLLLEIRPCGATDVLKFPISEISEH